MRPPWNITEWIGIFQFEEYGSPGADRRKGKAIAHFNDFLARYGELPAKVSKHSRFVTAPISELKAWHIKEFFTAFLPQEVREDVGEEWYSPILARFIQWLKDNGAITDAKREELLAALTELGPGPSALH